jgi:two-component system sensor histidine kinase KdpD
MVYNLIMYTIIPPFLLLIVLSLISKLFSEELQLVNIGMIHLIPILYAAMRSGRRDTLIVSLASVLSFNFFFIPPILTFTVHDLRYVFSFTIMIAVGQIVSWLSERAALAKELETSERLQETLLGSLSHELRTPLAAIMGASSGLLTEELDLNPEQKKELYHTIDNGAHRMRRLIDNLLDTARLQSGMLKLKIQECDIRELLGSALSKTEHIFPASLTMNEEIPSVHGDAVLIEQALFNLLENAFKYGDAVNVAVEREPEGVMIRICNTGSIPSIHEASMAWRAFSRLSNVRGEEGIGLGLYVAYRIAKMHGGSVETMSDGIQFCATLRFPLRG